MGAILGLRHRLLSIEIVLCAANWYQTHFSSLLDFGSKYDHFQSQQNSKPANKHRSLDICPVNLRF